MPLPIRYLTDDGIYAIDLFFRWPSSGLDLTIRRIISEPAKSVINQCVLRLGKRDSITRFSKFYLIFGIEGWI